MRARFCGRVSRTHVSQEERSRADKKCARLLLARSRANARVSRRDTVSPMSRRRRRDQMMKITTTRLTAPIRRPLVEDGFSLSSIVRIEFLNDLECCSKRVLLGARLSERENEKRESELRLDGFSQVSRRLHPRDRACKQHRRQDAFPFFPFTSSRRRKILHCRGQSMCTYVYTYICIYVCVYVCLYIYKYAHDTLLNEASHEILYSRE